MKNLTDKKLVTNYDRLEKKYYKTKQENLKIEIKQELVTLENEVHRRKEGLINATPKIKFEERQE